MSLDIKVDTSPGFKGHAGSHRGDDDHEVRRNARDLADEVGSKP